MFVVSGVEAIALEIEVIGMMRSAAAAVMFLCSITTVSAQEPTVASDRPEQKTYVFAGENYSGGAEFCVARPSNVRVASGHETLS
jgi:hypothetical protein